jgi:predicted acylesterase/phospholipase RssA
MRFDLVFEGGGAKGIAFVGAIDELFRRGHSFDRLLGTSAGAITAALLAAGYGPQELLAALAEQEDGRPVFAGFLGVPPPFTREELARSELGRVLGAVDLALVPDALERRAGRIAAALLLRSRRLRHVAALLERGGWFSAEPFLSWLAARLDAGAWRGERRAFSGATLAQLHAATAVELSVVVSDTTDGKLLVLNHHTAPECPLAWAVRMSMSIPLLWDEVIWQPRWGKYLGRDLAGHAIVDGGVLSNFPLELFVSDAPQVQRVMGPKRGTPVLGLLVDEALPVAPAAARRGALAAVRLDLKELRIVQRLLRLVDTATNAHDKMVLDEHEHLVARLPAAGYGTTEFDMSEARRAALVDAGRAAMAAWFDRAAAVAAAPRARAAIAGPAGSRADRLAIELLERSARPGPGA